MTLDPLAGHVVVLGGVDAGIGLALLDCGAMVAVVTSDRGVIDELEHAATRLPAAVLLAYHADPVDPSTWARLSPHIEQRVGPIDAVLCSRETSDVATATFAEDMRRRGHGAIVEVSPEVDPVEVLRQRLHRKR